MTRKRSGDSKRKCSSGRCCWLLLLMLLLALMSSHDKAGLSSPHSMRTVTKNLRRWLVCVPLLSSAQRGGLFRTTMVQLYLSHHIHILYAALVLVAPTSGRPPAGGPLFLCGTAVVGAFFVPRVLSFLRFCGARSMLMVKKKKKEKKDKLMLPNTFGCKLSSKGDFSTAFMGENTMEACCCFLDMH